jgi:hypothetical protein
MKRTRRGRSEKAWMVNESLNIADANQTRHQYSSSPRNNASNGIYLYWFIVWSDGAALNQSCPQKRCDSRWGLSCRFSRPEMHFVKDWLSAQCVSSLTIHRRFSYLCTIWRISIYNKIWFDKYKWNGRRIFAQNPNLSSSGQKSISR